MIANIIEISQARLWHPILKVTKMWRRGSTKTELTHHSHIACTTHIAKCLDIAEIELRIRWRHITRYIARTTHTTRLVL